MNLKQKDLSSWSQKLDSENFGAISQTNSMQILELMYYASNFGVSYSIKSQE